MRERVSFEKQANSWELADIDKLVGTEEGVYLEFKKPSEFMREGKFSPDLLSAEMSETVSAFLNSDGGVILLGVQTDKPNKDKRTEALKKIETWSSDQTFEHLQILLTSSRIRELINSNIIPRPVGIEVKDLQVHVRGSSTTIFIVTVVPSPLGAHQSVKTQRYYRRTGDGDDPMLDFEIRAVNSRRAGPLLYLACKVSNATGTPFEEEWKKSSVDMERVDAGDKTYYRINLVFAASNFGRGTASISRFDVGIPAPWRVEHYSPDGTNVQAYWGVRSGLQYSIGNRVTMFWTPVKCHDIPLPYRNKAISEQTVEWQQAIYSANDPPAHPIWPASGPRVIGVLRLQRQNYGNEPFLWLPWRAFSDDMLEIRGAVLVREDTGTFYVFNYEMDDVWWCYPAESEQKFEELKQRFGVR